jgi:hypothetical protein
MAMNEFEERAVNPKAGRKPGKMPPPNPNKDRNPTKEKGPVEEPGDSEPMVLMPDTLNPTPKRGRPITSTEKAAQKANSSTVNDGEAG